MQREPQGQRQIQRSRPHLDHPEELRLDDLRHTTASLMIRQGASVKAVQKELGHATASITLDTYGHLFPDELDALADRLEDARTDAYPGSPCRLPCRATAK
jgi:integrase